MMSNLDKKARLLDELCIEGQLETFRPSVEKILNDIIDKGCKVSTRYDVEYSNIQTSAEKGSHIRVSLKAVQHPLDILWKLLHEYGHFLSGKTKSDNFIDIESEELAWEYADKLLEGYPELLQHKESYIECKKECLETYYNALSRHH